MATQLDNSASTPSLKSPKKLSLSPSTKKSWCQIFITLLITFSIVGGIACLENYVKNEHKNDKVKNEHKNDKVKNEHKNDNCEYKFKIICLITDSKLLGQLQNIGVLSAAILFFWETFDRKKQLERQAWQLIDGAQGSETSGARKQAIEELYSERADITGLDADGADLRGINLSGANLTRASFKNAILEGANFEGANLTQANFTGANLQGANFKKATLVGTNFTKSNLMKLVNIKEINNKERKTDFRDANLSLAIFNEAQLAEAIFGIIDEPKKSNQSQQSLGSETKLNGAKFWDTKLDKINLRGVDISQVQFGGAKVNIDVIAQANKHTEAYYGQDFCEQNNLGNVDKGYQEYRKSQLLKARRMIEITQYITNNKSVSSIDDKELSDLVTLLKLLKNFIKDSDNSCFEDNGLLDQVLKVEDAIQELGRSEQEASTYYKNSQEQLKGNDEEYQEAKRCYDSD